MENIKFSFPAEIMGHKIWFFNNSLDNQIKRYIEVGVLDSKGMSEENFRKLLEFHRPLENEKNYLLVIGERLLLVEKLIDLLVYKGEKAKTVFPIEYVKDKFKITEDFYFAYDVEYGKLYHAIYGIQQTPETINRRCLTLREAVCLLLQYGVELVDSGNKKPEPIIMGVTGSIAEWWGPSADWWIREEWGKEKLNKRRIYIIYSEQIVRKPFFNLDIDLSGHTYVYVIGVPTCKIVE